VTHRDASFASVVRGWAALLAIAPVIMVLAVPGAAQEIDPASEFVLYSCMDGYNWLKDSHGDRQILEGEQARLSPDGRYIVYRDDDIPSGDLWVHDLLTANDTFLFNGYDYLDSFAWTPDGSQIVFDHSCGIYVINRDGTGQQQLVDNWPPGGNDCLNDGVHVNPVDGRLAWLNWDFDIAVSEPDGDNPYWVPNTDGGVYPVWSPDGAWIAFFDYSNLYKIRPDGSNLTQLSFLPGSDDVEMTGAWTQDGQWIAAPAEDGGVGRIFLFATDGSGRMLQVDVQTATEPWYVGSIGNLFIFIDDFESGDLSAWSGVVP